MKRVAITGGIGSGKSVVLQMIKERGYPVFSCDDIYKNIANSKEYVQEIGKLFPTAVENGVLNRELLGGIVFRDQKAREKLNKISHPLIMKTLKENMSEVNAPLVFAEVPLLFEGGFERDFDEIIVVLRSRTIRNHAIQARNGISEALSEARIRAQFDYDDLDNQSYIQSLGAYIIQNNHNLDELKKQVNQMILNLQNKTS